MNTEKLVRHWRLRADAIRKGYSVETRLHVADAIDAYASLIDGQAGPIGRRYGPDLPSDTVQSLLPDNWQASHRAIDEAWKECRTELEQALQATLTGRHDAFLLGPTWVEMLCQTD